MLILNLHIIGLNNYRIIGLNLNVTILNSLQLNIKYQYTVGIIVYTLPSFLKRTYVSRNALNLNFNKLQYEDFTSCIFTFI